MVCIFIRPLALSRKVLDFFASLVLRYLLMTSTRCGISAKQMERELGVTYKTAWRICKEIRIKVMKQQDDETLSGTVELDETYVGGKRRGTPRGRPEFRIS